MGLVNHRSPAYTLNIAWCTTRPQNYYVTGVLNML
jgi:hypothetical protein